MRPETCACTNGRAASSCRQGFSGRTGSGSPDLPISARCRETRVKSELRMWLANCRSVATHSMKADDTNVSAVDIGTLQRILRASTPARGLAQLFSDRPWFCSSRAMLLRASSIPCDSAGAASLGVQQNQRTTLRQASSWQGKNSRSSINNVVPSRAFVTGVGHATRRHSANYLQALRLARCVACSTNLVRV